MGSRQLTILFSGMIAGDPHQGGATWAVLQYLLGLRRLGHDVFFVEPLKADSIRPKDSPLADSENAAYFRQIVAEFELENRAALLLESSVESVGLTRAQLLDIASRTDVLVNVSGMLSDTQIISR